MELKRLAWLAAALLGLTMLWRLAHSPLLRELWLEQWHEPVAIQFDNGTVREYQPASAPAGATPPGVMRKCKRGAETSYTNTACPPAARSCRSAAPSASFSGGAATPRPVATGQAAPPARGNLYEVLDMRDASAASDKRINPVVNDESARR